MPSQRLAPRSIEAPLGAELAPQGSL